MGKFTAEDMVKLLATNPSPFSLAGDLPEFKEGLQDLVARLQALEAEVYGLKAQKG